MNAEQAERFQQLLDEACQRFIASGKGNIIIVDFISERGQCPITCLVGRDHVKNDGINLKEAAVNIGQILDCNVSEPELWAFIHAFDAGFNIFPEDKQYVSAILVGKALRQKYIKEET